MLALRLLGAAALLIALGTAAQAQTPKRGGTLVIGSEGETPNLDCQQQASVYLLSLARPFYSTLVRFDTNNFPKIVGDLADSWTTAPDGLTYTFKLRTDVKFHDGTPFSSADAKATFDRILKPPAGAPAVRKADFEDVTAVEAPDPATVVFKLAQPNPAMIELIANPFNCILSARKLTENANYPATTPVGTGAFRYDEWQKGATLTGKRFDGYFRQGLPYLDGFRVVIMAPSAPINGIIAGQIDAFFVRGFAPAEEERVRKELGDKISVETAALSQHSQMLINVKRKPFDDPRIRRALTLALDRRGALPSMQKLVSVSGVGGVLRQGYDLALKPDELAKMPGFWPDIEASRAEARRLLAEAGAPNQKVMLLGRSSGAGVPLGIFAIDQWRRVGFDAVNEALEPAIVISRQQAGDFDVTSDSWSVPVDDPTAQFVRYLPGSPVNIGGITDPMLTELFQKQKVSVNLEDRRKLVNAFERQVLEQAYYLPMFWSAYSPGYRSYVKGWKVVASGRVGFDLVELWKDQ